MAYDIGTAERHKKHKIEGKTHGDCQLCQEEMIAYGQKRQAANAKAKQSIEKPSLPDLSDKDYVRVHCLACDAQPGEPCKSIMGDNVLIDHFHRPRKLLAYRSVMGEFWPQASTELNDSEKAMICFAAFTFLADSVSQHSETILGRKFDSKAIQAFFVQAAINELRKDQLI